ncbi:MAG: hypothetical protein H6737_05700 [Alphaproteobacteria bacterium]|nr:hypothetical protein [Alphaproteobacteria bacterium]
MRTLFCFVAVLLSGCGGLDAVYGDQFDLADAVPIDRETGKPLLDAQGRNAGLEAPGPRTSGLRTSTEVWNVYRRWYELDAEAGMAWPADSGLTWDQKYSAWVDAMEKIVGDDGTMTVQLITPLGQTVPSPRLECAEMAMFLRTTFAAWYGLPFFMTAYHPTYGDVHFGHFGVVKPDGSPLPGYPNYKTRYPDESARGVDALDAWPSDYDLAARKLTVLADDYNLWMGDEKYAGAYFDHILLNKRVGHFLHVLLTNFGSMHLAYSENTFDLDPSAMREGDLLVHRWQRQGIGHVMVVKEVDQVDAQHLSAEIVFGSMPRIQPAWYSPDNSRYYFLSEDGGGKEISGDGVPYSQLGGGLKRWRTPVVKGGRWLNIIPVADRPVAIDSNDQEAISARIEQMEALFGELSDEDRLAQLLGAIELARDNLSRKPASCANRTRREEAFDELYTFLENSQGMTRDQVDAQYRTLEDYVYAELEYNAAKTCCWNSTTPDMHTIIMDFNRDRAASAAPNECMDPVVFKARDGDYALFRNYAVATGRADLWRAWSEDETCPQRDVQDDSEANTPWADWCDLPAGQTAQPPVQQDPCGGVTFEGQCDGDQLSWCENDTVNTAQCGAGSCGWDAGQSYYNCL